MAKGSNLDEWLDGKLAGFDGVFDRLLGVGVIDDREEEPWKPPVYQSLEDYLKTFNKMYDWIPDLTSFIGSPKGNVYDDVIITPDVTPERMQLPKEFLLLADDLAYNRLNPKVDVGTPVYLSAISDAKRLKKTREARIQYVV